MYLPDISALLALPSPISPNEFVVAGYFEPGDGGGGTFVWITNPPPPGTPPNPDNGIVFYHPNDNSGYFKRLFSGPVNVRWFGAKGDGVTDDSATVNLAVLAAKRGTVYFPESDQPYLGNFYFEECHVQGDGYDTLLKPYNPSFPVISLGYNTAHSSHWAFRSVSRLRIDGSYGASQRAEVGISFDDPSQKITDGRWVIEEVEITECKKGIFKPKGNIGNTYRNCSLIRNDFGYYATDDPNMHAGNEHFIGGHMDKNSLSAFYIEAQGMYGQLILDGTVIENNFGFAMFIRLKDPASMLFHGLELRNVWTEGNARSATVKIGTDNYTSRDLYFENIRSVSIYETQVRDIELINTSVLLYSCRSDDYYNRSPWNWPYYIGLNDNSSIIARELRYAHTVSENIFVESISYDGSSDILQQAKALTSVWGPLRNRIVRGAVHVKFGSLLNTTSQIAFSGGLFTSPNKAGVLDSVCAHIGIPTGGEASYDLGFYLTKDKYYFWSVHSFHDRGPLTGKIASDDFALGQVILKPYQWACSYGIKKCTVSSTKNLGISFANPSTTISSSVRLADLQIVEFDNLPDAVSFANSRAFALKERSGEEPSGPMYPGNVPTLYTRGFFKYHSHTGELEIESNVNIEATERLSMGVYRIGFVLPLEFSPVPQITFASPQSGESGVSGYFENLSADGLTVRVLDADGNPADSSFALSVG